jgi:hypothetical protein
MDKYIKIYNDVISSVFCDKIVTKFEKNSSQMEIVDNEQRPSFQQINLHKHNEWAKFRSSLDIVFKKYIKQYKEDCGITEYHWPEQYGFEQYRMKRYLPNNKDQFKPHVDVQNYDSARRFLVFFLYCNDNEAGQTIFNDMDINVSCSKASLLMFPPLWNYLHSGAKPIDKPKYIIGSYLHYI